jgi:hypothetical protein
MGKNESVGLCRSMSHSVRNSRPYHTWIATEAFSMIIRSRQMFILWYAGMQTGAGRLLTFHCILGMKQHTLNVESGIITKFYYAVRLSYMRLSEFYWLCCDVTQGWQKRGGGDDCPKLRKSSLFLFHTLNHSLRNIALDQWYSTWGTLTPGGTRRHLRGYVN